MICGPCKKTDHHKCVGGTWCQCQHQPPGTGMPVPYDELVVQKMGLPIGVEADELRVDMGINEPGHFLPTQEAP